MPIIYETEKNIENKKKVNFNVRSINIQSLTEATLSIIDIKTAIGMHKLLNWSISMSRLDGGTYKQNFEVNLIKNNLNEPTKLLQINGDLIQAIKFLTRSFISEKTEKEALEILTGFENKEESKENPKNFQSKPY